MRKTFLGVLFAMLLVILFGDNPARAEDVKSGSNQILQSQISQEEGTCLKSILDRIKILNSIGESEAKAFESVVSSGRYTACSLLSFFKEYYGPAGP